MYPGVELRLYRYVAVLAEELNFTRAAQRLHAAQPSLSKQIRELENYLGAQCAAASHRYDGKEVKEIPIASVVATERYPVVGGDEYEEWLNSIVAFGAGAGAKTAWDLVTDSSELKGFQRVLAEERVLLSIVTVGAFGGGYLVGHKFQPSFEGPLFRAAPPVHSAEPILRRQVPCLHQSLATDH